jgi:hypothetical protein
MSGMMTVVWDADVTKLSFIILAIFAAASLKCGYDIYKYENYKNVHKREIELGWFLSETLLALGMIGTVIGFILIMKDFVNLDVQNIQSVQSLIKSLGSGIATALYTTLFGLVGSTFLKLQYFLLEDLIEKNDEQI